VRAFALLLAVALGGAALPGPELDPAQLSLPRQGLVGKHPGGIVLRDLRGRVLGHLSGFRVVDLYARLRGGRSSWPTVVGRSRSASTA
jgi:hypothetical protein